MPLPGRGVDLHNVGPRLPDRHFDRHMALVASGILEVRSVFETVQRECRPECCIILHPFGLLDVTGNACIGLFIGLMVVTGVALGMPRHACLEASIVKPMTEVTPGRAFGHLPRIHLILHLLGVRMIAMRKTLDPELSKSRREFDSGKLRIDRHRMADAAHRSCFVCEVSCVALDTGRMPGQNGPGIVVRAHVASRAVLSLRFVLLAIVIEGRDDLDHLRVYDVERQLAGRRRSSAVNRLVKALHVAAASPQAKQDSSRYRDYLP